MSENRTSFLTVSKIYYSFFAFLLVVFVNSGFVKSFLKAANLVELDVTILALIILAPLSSFLMIKHVLMKEQLIIVMLFFLFITLYSCSALYTTSQSYYVSKLFALTGLVFSFVFGMISRFEIRTFFYNFYAFFTVVAVSIYFMLIFSNLSVESLNDFTGNSLVAGEMLGAAILIFYFGDFRYKYALIIFSFAVMIALGARGPLLFSFVILIFIALFNIRKMHVSTPLKVFSVIAILFLGFTSSDNEVASSVYKTFNDGLSRFVLLFEDNKGDSVNSRTIMISKTLEHIENNIFLGTGIGSFGVEIYGQDYRAYPHNVPLEIWFESGVVPFIIFNLFVFIILIYLFKKKEYLLLSLFLYLLFNINKSSSLEELRFLFLIAGLSISSVNVKESKSIAHV